MNRRKGVYTKTNPQNQAFIKYYYQGYSSTEIKQISLRFNSIDTRRVEDVVGKIVKYVQPNGQDNKQSAIQQVNITLLDSGIIFQIGSDFQMIKENDFQKEYILKPDLKKTSIDLFSMKLCDHFPTEEVFNKIKKQIANIQNPVVELQQKKLKKSKKRVQILPIKCRFCFKLLDFFYFQQEKQVNIKEVFNQLQIDEIQQIQQIQWEVILNQHFTKNTTIAKFQDKQLKLDQCGKITFLVDWNNVKSNQLKNSFVILKYRNIYCKHQKVQDNMCQFCLENVDPIELNLKKYLFQMEMDDNCSKEIITSGDALLYQQNQFVQKLYANNKAILILDLDNTVLHSIEQNKISDERLKQFDQYYQIPFTSGIRHATIYTCFIVKMRPYLKQFLEWICEYYQIYVYTKGTRSYAESICNCIREQYGEQIFQPPINKNDKMKKYSFLKDKNCFKLNRIITRDEDNDLYSKSLENILPTRQDCLMIMDDLKEVWKHSLSCLHTIPYYFFWKIQKKKQSLVKLMQSLDEFKEKMAKSMNEFEKNMSKLENSLYKFEEKMTTKKQQITQKTENFQKQQSEPLMKLACDQFEQEIVETEKQIKQKEQTGQLQFVSEIVDLVKQKNHIQYDIKPVKDYFMIYAAEALIQIHRNFFSNKNRENINSQQLSMAKAHKSYRNSFFSGKIVKFCMDYEQLIDVYGRTEKLGLKICKKNSQQTQIPHYIIRLNNMSKNLDRVYFKKQEQQYKSQIFKKRQELTKNIIKKLKHYSQTLKIPIVSQSWISMSYLYTYPFQVSQFVISQQKIFDDIKQQDFNWIVQKNAQLILQMRQKIHKAKYQ